MHQALAWPPWRRGQGPRRLRPGKGRMPTAARQSRSLTHVCVAGHVKSGATPDNSRLLEARAETGSEQSARGEPVL